MMKAHRKGQPSAQATATAVRGGKMHLNVHRDDEDADDGSWPRFRVPPSQAQPKAVFTSCHYCGYDPDVIPDDGTCPKCGGHSWERNAISVRLLPKGSDR